MKEKPKKKVNNCVSYSSLEPDVTLSLKTINEETTQYIEEMKKGTYNILVL